ncbi:MAG: hypothetical protein WBB29_19280 [Geitlerinemataceae cyanobacterium]
MKTKNIAFSLGILAIGFILAGDKLSFLPTPVRQASIQSRTAIGGLFPDWIAPTDRNSTREQQIEKLEGK